MTTDHRAALASIRRFDQLIAYLRDEMGWPIDTDDFEELTFEYTPEELGIDAKNAAKIQQIKRLRPLSTRQPWGVFFVKFEPKRLPVVALRRILSQVALKKRASANSAERAAWSADDLLFVSSYGEGASRQISFAHFSQSAAKKDMPTLKVLGWDNRDTPLHLDHVAEFLTERLAWPDDEENEEVWRKQWRSAFTLMHREVITTSKRLSMELAGLARSIRDRINTVLAIETEDGPVSKLMVAFKEALVHDLDEDGFADMYAQTIAYGLLSARVANPASNTADSFAAAMPVTNPFLRELMETFLDVGGHEGGDGRGPRLDFDELGVGDVVDLLDAANMEAVVRDFGDRNPQEDPIIHFYELFLREYDAKKRMQRGVFYTPRPVVSFIVCSVDELLRTEFGLEDGLADTSTWGEMADRIDSLEIPDGVTSDQAFVQILDPATGTGTFLVEVIGLIHTSMIEKWRAQGHSDETIAALWNKYVPEHLLPRLHGYELLMAPYAIAHLKIALKLCETGYSFGSDERVQVYLTNSLEPPSSIGQQRLGGILPALAHEAQAVNAIKQEHRFTVILGNPPYSVSSANESRDSSGSLTFIGALIEDYKRVDGEGLAERNPKSLQDDYVKFIRFAQHQLTYGGVGILGYITNHGYLDNVTFRGMRRSMMQSFSKAWIRDLHGNSKKKEVPPDGSEDENVFDIQQGVALLLAVAMGTPVTAQISHAELWGKRAAKYCNLLAFPRDQTQWSRLSPTAPLYLFVPQSVALLSEHEQAWKLTDIFKTSSSCMNTARDALVIDTDRQTLENRIARIASCGDRAADVAGELGIKSTGWWRFTDAVSDLVETPGWRELIIKCLYRPFDERWLFHHPSFIDRPRAVLNRCMLQRNISLVTTRQTKEQFAVVATRLLCGQHKIAAVYDRSYFFPLYLDSDGDGGLASTNHRSPNLNKSFLKAVAERLGLPQDGGDGLPSGLSADEVFQYAFAVLSSPTYRVRYADFLKTDFARLPLVSALGLFRELARLGGELIALHLLESPSVDDYITTVVGSGRFQVEKVSYSDKTVWITRAKTHGFLGVPTDVWAFRIGGYQVCEKWLKDRQAKGGKNPRAGRVLTSKDIDHYQKIIVALSETIRVMAEIDEVIETHGGWPGAFTHD